MRRRQQATAALLVAIALAGCGSDTSPEDAVRAVIDTAEEAAEARDAPALVGLIAPDYGDARGNGAEEIGRYVRGYLLAHQSIRLLTRIESIDFPGTDLARVRATVGMVGREAEAAGAWDLAADVYEFDVTLALEDGEWRGTRADWRRAIGG